MLDQRTDAGGKFIAGWRRRLSHGRTGEVRGGTAAGRVAGFVVLGGTTVGELVGRTGAIGAGAIGAGVVGASVVGASVVGAS